VHRLNIDYLNNSVHGGENVMPPRDSFPGPVKPQKLQGEKAIVSAVAKYFETAPSLQKSASEDTESSIINALHRYFVTK